MPARDDMAYQLWMVHADGSTAPGPTFVPQGGEVLAFVEGDLAAVTALTVTVEPMGGSDVPTGAVVATVAV
jgi:anti-sigma-K factor RskA